MKEDFLHFLWLFQYFDKKDLCTTQGETLSVLQVGNHNADAGADFSLGKVKIGGVDWAGDIEIHLKSSDWNAHQHQHNPAYNNVILHVVWQDDAPALRADNTPMPTLELKDRTNPKWLDQYQVLLSNKDVIPCARQFASVKTIQKLAMLDKALAKRLEDKAFLLRALLVKNKQDWDETTYQVLAKNFGFKVNSEPFLRLSQGLPLKVLRKSQDSIFQLEALLLGQAGLLHDKPNAEKVEDEYIDRLRKEHHFLQRKHRLEDEQMSYEHWKFMRLRPTNFPTIRLAQFASLIHQQQNLFSLFFNNDYKTLAKKLQVSQSAYWQQHYTPGKPAKKPVPLLGKDSIENIVINTVVPLLVLYAKEKKQDEYMERATGFLEYIKAENNHILRMWEDLGLKVKTAFDSQALIELYNNFCTPRKCLQCSIGISIVKNPN
ncbi:DUF2851 family protein [Microscilla marina]|uniref:DUF2851 domain-containing protein n=1 Tax=Microscilla marina ATCC 23134 TaxID=313606 RepID=A1ZE21_MICM2|nr:DUF2851 family protein [Microscilla marina]EAY31329.1 conserved hypothetical protein [Microscilla marina ATCC 23134]